VFLTAFPSIEDRWGSAIWMVAALTMVLGNVIAVVQPNIKRMLAYSSIAHAGYVAVAFAATSNQGVSAALFYLLAYSLTNLGAFAMVTIISRKDDKVVDVTDYAGLGSKRPGLAAVLSIPAFIGRRTWNGGFCRKVFYLSGGGRIPPGLVGDHRCRDDGRILLLLPLRYRTDVHARTT